MLEDIISVPLPPADCEGKKDPNIQRSAKRKIEDEDAITRSFQEQ